MTVGRVLAELEALAARLGVRVRAEPFERGVGERRGGLCWLDGRPVVVMDEKLPVTDRIAVLARALGQLDLNGVSVPPLLRDRIDAARARPRARARSERTGSRPGLARAKPRGLR